MAKIIFLIIVALIVFDYLSEQLLQYLNDSYRKKDLPEEGKDIYNPQEYARQQLYESDKSRFSIITETFSLVLILSVLFLNGFAFLDDFLRRYTENPIYLALLFFGIISFISDIISTPFAVYSTFVIETKYGFNKTTIKTFIFDKLKGWFLSLLIGIPLFSFIVWIYDKGGDTTWLIAWGGIAVFVIFFTFFYSSLIVPLFNKQTPLQDGDLRSAIQDFSSKVGFRLKNVFVINGSKRSAKANAYFSGFGSKKRIVLYDTLIEQLNIEELVAVLAHEIGHYKKKHVIKNMVISLLEMGLMLFVLSVFIKNPILSQALGVLKPSFHVGVVTFGILYGFFSTLLGIVMNLYSRANEYEADKFAAVNYNAEALISGLKKLTVKNLSNLNPHPWYVFVNYSHPPLLQRIKAMRSLNLSLCKEDKR